jgi:hypothetical protein
MNVDEPMTDCYDKLSLLNASYFLNRLPPAFAVTNWKTHGVGD